MTPHTKSWDWLSGEDRCTECNEDWPCRDMRIWQSGHRAGLEDIKKKASRLEDRSSDWQQDFYDLKAYIDIKLKEQA